MMDNPVSTICLSDSLISSLCREIEKNRNRYLSIKNALRTTHNDVLSMRLKNELHILKQRHEELRISALALKDVLSPHSLSIDFLVELSNRHFVFNT